MTRPFRPAVWTLAARDLAFVAKQLAELYEPDEAYAGLYSRSRLLGPQRPVDLISKGDVDSVLQVVALLKDGAYA